MLDRVVDAAASAARAEGLQKHRFQVAQLPLNAFENGAVLGRTPGEKRDRNEKRNEKYENNGNEMAKKSKA